MSSSPCDMEVQLNALQCHFTWNISESDISGRDSHNLDFNYRSLLHSSKGQSHATHFNIMAFVSHLQGENGTALGFLSEAEEILKERKDDTELLVTYGNYAWVHYHSDNLEEVRVYLEKVEEIHKTLPQGDTLPLIHGEKGWTFLRLGSSLYERSRESFEKALEGEPENVSHNVGYAVALYRLEGLNKDPTWFRSKATAQLRKALYLEPGNAEVMVLLALRLQSEKRNGRWAQQLITEALEIAPDVPQITRYVARYLRMEGCLVKSLEMLHEALEREPNASFLYHQIGLCYKDLIITLENWRASSEYIRTLADNCIWFFSKAAELKPSNTYAIVNLAEAYAYANEGDEAERIFKELLRDDRVKPTDLQHFLVCYGRYHMYVKKNESAAAVEFQRAYRIPIQSWERVKAGKKLRTLAYLLGGKGKSEESKEILDFLRFEDDQLTRSKMVACDADAPEMG